MQGNMKCCYACDREITLVTLDFLTGKCPPVSFKAKSQHKLSTRPGIPEADVARAFRPFCSRNIGWWHFSNISSDTSARWAHESTSLDVKRPMKCWLATLNVSSPTMSHALEKTKAARIGLICKSASSKLRFLLAWLLCFYTENPRIFFWKAIFATSPIVPAVTIHTLPWKMRVATCPLSFSMASSLVLFLFGHGVETSNLGDVSAQKLCQASGDFSLEQVGIDVSAPCRHDSNSIDVYTATHARGSRKVQDDRWRSLCVVCGLLAMFRNRKSSNLSSEIHKYRPSISYHAASLVLFVFGHGVETSNLGDVSAQKLCQASGDFSLEQVGIDISAPCTHDSNSIDVYTATHAKGSRKVQEDRWRSLCVVRGLLAMFRKRKWLFSDFPISVRKSTNIALQVLIMQSLLVEETRCWKGH